jgi:hypothetical protein
MWIIKNRNDLIIEKLNLVNYNILSFLITINGLFALFFSNYNIKI